MQQVYCGDGIIDTSLKLVMMVLVILDTEVDACQSSCGDGKIQMKVVMMVANNSNEADALVVYNM